MILVGSPLSRGDGFELFLVRRSVAGFIGIAFTRARRVTVLFWFGFLAMECRSALRCLSVSLSATAFVVMGALFASAPEIRSITGVCRDVSPIFLDDALPTDTGCSHYTGRVNCGWSCYCSAVGLMRELSGCVF